MTGESESDTIRALERLFRSPAARRAAVVGIGDDSAVLRKGEGRLVWTIDTAVEHVHFRFEWLSPFDVGARAFHAAVSDVAAMGARPTAALSNLVVPKTMTGAAVRELAKGQACAAAELRCPIVGGNLSRGGELSVTTTVIGRARKPILRSGARAADELWLMGEVGLARAGLLCLSARMAGGAKAKSSVRRSVADCVEAWKHPRALVKEGLRLARSAHAAIDVSDGLAADAGHLAERSGVRIVIEERRLRATLAPSLLDVGAALSADPLELALVGGEDYALIATGPRRARPRGARRIGRVERGRGVFLETDGSLRRVRGGFDHFEKSAATTYTLPGGRRLASSRGAS
jgi:thiamine-monophosphate kinase